MRNISDRHQKPKQLNLQKEYITKLTIQKQKEPKKRHPKYYYIERGVDVLIPSKNFSL